MISFCECLCESVNWIEARVNHKAVQQRQQDSKHRLGFQLCFLSASHRLSPFIAAYIIEGDSKDSGETA